MSIFWAFRMVRDLVWLEIDERFLAFPSRVTSSSFGPIPDLTIGAEVRSLSSKSRRAISLFDGLRSIGEPGEEMPLDILGLEMKNAMASEVDSEIACGICRSGIASSGAFFPKAGLLLELSRAKSRKLGADSACDKGENGTGPEWIGR